MYKYVYVVLHILQTRVDSIYHPFVLKICKFHCIYIIIYRYIYIVVVPHCDYTNPFL